MTLHIYFKTIVIAVFFLGLNAFTLNSLATTKLTEASNNKNQLAEKWGKIPLYFERNQGQTNKKVHYLSRGYGYQLFLTQEEVVLMLQAPVQTKTKQIDENNIQNVKSNIMRLHFIGANKHPPIEAGKSLPGKSNYLLGKNPQQWITHIPHYATVTYQQLYSGIDMVFHGKQQKLEYDFVVAPNTDPKVIRIGFNGTKKLSLDAKGNLIIALLDDSQLIMQKPKSFQTIVGKEKFVESSYVVLAKNEVGFIVGKYNKELPLTIDPAFVYSTYLGGTALDLGTGVAVNNQGEAFVTGATSSLNFPTTAGAFQQVNAGILDAFVTKLTSDGTALIYSTYLGGSGIDQGSQISVDNQDNAYVTGATTSPNFPTVNPFQAALNGSSDAFVTKLNADGTALIYSTYIGGSGAEVGNGIFVDKTRNAYITGSTNSPNYPLVNPFQGPAGGQDAFVTRFSRDGNALVFSTYLGGTTNDSGSKIVVDPNKHAYVVGQTDSIDFPTTPGAFDNTYNGGVRDAFITKFDRDGDVLIYSTYLGGNNRDVGRSIDVDQEKNAYVSGITASVDFPTQNAFQPALNGSSDAFVTKLNPDGSALEYSTYLGGSGDEDGLGIAVHVHKYAHVTGRTSSTDFPIVNAIQPVFGGVTDAFVTKFTKEGTALIYSTYLGGSLSDNGLGIAVDANLNAYIVGDTESLDFPVTPGAFQPANGGTIDAFVTKICGCNCNTNSDDESCSDNQ